MLPLRATAQYWVNRFQRFAEDVEQREKRGDFGKWPWQREYGLWPWQRGKK